MDFSQSLNDMFSRLVIKNDKLTNDEKNRLLKEGINEPIIDKEPVFFEFDKEPVLEAELMGNGEDFIYEGNPVQCWNFKDRKNNIFQVPKYDKLRPSFDEATPGQYFYKIIYTGEKKLEGGGYSYEFTVFRKLK